MDGEGEGGEVRLHARTGVLGGVGWGGGGFYSLQLVKCENLLDGDPP